jgi:hypothetical protein
MLRTTLLAMVIMAVSLALAVPVAPAAPTDAQCAASQANQTLGDWDILCGTESACGADTLCLRTVARDALGDFYVCRCNGGQMSRCCQLVLRFSTRLPEARGNCTDCGESGECNMKILSATTYKSDCRLGGVQRW